MAWPTGSYSSVGTVQFQGPRHCLFGARRGQRFEPRQVAPLTSPTTILASVGISGEQGWVGASPVQTAPLCRRWWTWQWEIGGQRPGWVRVSWESQGCMGGSLRGDQGQQGLWAWRSWLLPWNRAEPRPPGDVSGVSRDPASWRPLTLVRATFLCPGGPVGAPWASLSSRD